MQLMSMHTKNLTLAQYILCFHALLLWRVPRPDALVQTQAVSFSVLMI